MRRRTFLGGALAGAAALLGRARAGSHGSAAHDPAAAAGTGFLGEPERHALAALADEVLPGAAGLGAVAYAETLLTAFDHDPPRIFAGGPFSGRRPFSENGRPGERHPENAFDDFLPLDRVQERAWRLRLHGSGAIPYPNEALLGPVVGLRDRVREGGRAAAAAFEAGGSAGAAWRATSEEFRTAWTELVIEAALADPVYGGNRNGAGWQLAHFEGDSLPQGYTLYDPKAGAYRERPEAPVTTIAPGEGPDPLGFWYRLVLRALGFFMRRAGP